MTSIQSARTTSEGSHLGHPQIHPAALEARERLVIERSKLRQQHEAGTVGIQVSNKLTTLFDEVVVTLFECIHS